VEQAGGHGDERPAEVPDREKRDERGETIELAGASHEILSEPNLGLNLGEIVREKRDSGHTGFINSANF
jgi:hypothetical protein